jgi:hypothetical protein
MEKSGSDIFGSPVEPPRTRELLRQEPPDGFQGQGPRVRWRGLYRDESRDAITRARQRPAAPGRASPPARRLLGFVFTKSNSPAYGPSTARAMGFARCAGFDPSYDLTETCPRRGPLRRPAIGGSHVALSFCENEPNFCENEPNAPSPVSEEIDARRSDKAGRTPSPRPKHAPAVPRPTADRHFQIHDVKQPGCASTRCGRSISRAGGRHRLAPRLASGGAPR